MLNNPQQRKALVLSLLMVMLAQTAYIEAYRGWKPAVELQEEETDVLRVGSPAVCSAASRTSGSAIHVDVVEGDDTYPGTTNCPKASLGAAVTLAASESASNPEIVLHEGLYHENVSINNLDNLLIRAADGDRVVFDGTRSITDDLGGVWGSADSDGIQEVTLTQDGWQLFLAYEEQVPARWPNAQFSDGTVFNRSYWAEGTLTGSNNAYTIGWLTDAGPEAGVHTGLNETINASGLDPVGAIAILNVGSFKTNSRIITDWNPNNGTFAYDGTGVGWKNKHHAYFLEGKRELIDQDGEWWFNNTNNRLHYKTPSGQDANDLDLRVKVQPFAISVDGSDGVTIQGIDFFGTTVNFNNCDGCSFTNATLEYPSTSKRGLGIAGESEDDRWMTRFYRSKHSFVDNISITNTDGGAIEFHGSGGQSHNNTVNNSYFYAIDWSASDQKGLMTTIYEGGRDMYFTNNSVHLTGASSVLSIGDAPKVFYNEVWDVGYLQTDGAVVQVMQGEAPGAEIAYNWIHDVIKYGARFDAPIGEVGEGRNGTMHHNVIWNAAGGLMVKGDYHDIHNNTVFNSTGKNDIIFLTDGGINNKNSTLHYNAVDAMADHRSDDIFANPIPYGTDWMNWNGYIQGKQDAVTTLNGEINSGGWVQTGYTCIINSTKSLLCWGYNANGQLGLGNTTHQSSPVPVAFPNAGTVEKVAESGGMPQHNCAIMTNGSLYCWGKNSYGELGIGSTTQQTTPQLVNLGSGVKAVDVSVGDGFTCAVTDAGALMCWGTNGNGRLGIGNTTSAVYSTPQTANLPTNRKAVDVQLGRHFGYALLDNGDVVSWGYNHVGYLGTGNTTTMYSPTVISLDSQRQVVSMSGGKHHGCIGYDNGSVVCTGRDNVGQQGTNSPSDVNDLTFSYTNALANLSIIAFAGKYTSCALLANGTAQCWGGGAVGQMGDGTTDNNAYPDDLVNTPSGRFIVDMSMSGEHACIVLDDGSVACWGRNNYAQLGLGNTTNQYQPVVLTGLDDLLTRSVHEMLVDPANNDFRPKWGSHLHVLKAGAYDADDANPWTAGISWTYTTPDAPIAGCMLDYADNYDADAALSDGSCLFSSYTPPSTLDLRLHLDPTNSSSYSGSGTNLVDLSTYYHNGTIDGATWAANRTRFTYDGTCTGNSPNFVCDEVNFTETNDHDPDTGGDWSVSTWFNASSLDAQQNTIVGKFDDGGTITDLGWTIRINTDGVRVEVGTTGNSSAAWTPRQAVATDRWYHVVMVADKGDSLAMFIDGVEVENISLASSGDLRNTGNGVSIGSYNAGEYNQPFDGQIGSVMAFADALNATNINQLYTAGKGVYSNTTTLSYAQSSSTLLLGQTYSFPLSVTNGEVTTSYSLNGTLPSGMNFESSNGTIWGTPTVTMTSTTYTVTANNSAGTYSTSMSLSTSYASSIELFPSAANSNLTIGQAMTNITFQTNGTYSIDNPSWTAADIAISADGAHSVVAADMDGDGDLDLVSASYFDNTIAWYENDGAANPSWTAADIATSAEGAQSVYVADMDGDGDLDIVSASYSDNTIAWYENDGAADPSWTAADIDTNADGAVDVYVADMDGDGDLDIVSASYNDSTIAWYENDGAANPSWTAADIDTNAAGAYSVYVADMDGDGDLDIVSASNSDDTIAWYENDGAADPSWTAADIDTNADGANSVYVADMDGDGDLDIVSASYNDDTIAWYENDGAANPTWTAANIATSADGATNIFVADVDGDGDLDIVSSSWKDDTIAWYENNGAANPSWTAADIATTVDGAYSVFVADMDGDGDLDIVSASESDDTIAWYEQTETRTWVTSFNIANPSWTAADIDTNADGARSVYVADMDGDGDLDIVSASYFDDTIAWYENDGAANPSWTAADIATSADGAYSVYVADMDGDGDLDIVSASYNDSTIAWYENDGAANPSWTAADIATSAAGASSVYVADLDDDGDLDIVSASQIDNTIAWYENDGAADPSWTAADIDTNADGAASVFVADMDGDGDLDIVSASVNDDTIAWYENDGAADPSWTAADIATSADAAYSVYVADMDGDGDLDIVSASYNDSTIAWYENDGAANPSWTAADIDTNADGALSVYVADMDGDGDLDIVSASVNDDTIAWYENDGAANPSWTAADIATSADYAFSVYVADMDGDGDLDIVSASQDDDTIAWYEQTGTRTWTYTNVTGANACTVSPSLPAGLSINSSTCTISGTPTALSTNTTYTVTANFSTGQGVGTFTLAVNYGSPVDLFATPSNSNLTLNQAMTNITFQYNARTAWMVKDIYSGSSSSTPSSLTAIGNTFYFTANDGSNGVELWKSDGTSAGTVMVKDIYSGSSSSSPSELTAVGSTLFFTANDGTNGVELWKSDGTSAGTVMVKDIRSGSSGSTPQYLTAVGSTLYFRAYVGTNGVELWKSDGTASGTVMVKDINSGSTSSSPTYLTAVGSTLFFTANDGTNGQELWKSDGTASGTVMVKDIRSGSTGSSSDYFAAVGNTLYFRANDGTNGAEVWKSDGTASGTVMVKDIYSGSYGSSPTYLTAVGSTLYFQARDGTNGYELWKSDGTSSGTVMVKDINSGSSNSYPYELTAVGNTLFFTATDGTNGYELWKSDGTSSGTVMVKDINSGSYGSSPAYLTAVGSTFYFQAWDGTNGYELWKSDGTSSGTVMVKDIYSGSTSSSPSELTAVGNTLYFRANDGTNGIELWAIDPANITGLSGGSGSGMTNVTGANACTVSPSLPSGLSIDSSTCTISGTPTASSISTTYTVTANFSTWQGVGNFTLAVNDEAPDIAYSPDWFVLTNNTAMQAVTPTNSGGAIPSAFFGYTGDAKATSIAVDSSGHKHVSYRDSSGLMYATDASGSWVTVTVDTASVWSSSIAIDSNDVLHLSYYDDNSADLKYATCSSACTTASNWNKVSVDTTGLVGYYSSMAIDSNDDLHISYFDDTNKDLKYATCSSGCTTASNWNIVSIDTSGGVGYYTSIAIDSNDALHISYFDNTNTDLKYATCSSSCTTASNWNAVSIDSFGSSIFNQEVRTDIAIDSNDGVHISYFDHTNDDLKYATCSSSCTTASNWNNVSVDTTGDVGYSASIGIDSNDHLHISYSDKTNNNLKYATCSSGCTTASNWNNETVDSSSVLTGEYTSIAIDANDFIHISYFDDTSNKIRYLALDSSSNILGYSVSPDLPTGLRLDPMIGKISGTPTQLSTNTTYTITVRNSGGVNTTTITIEVIDLVPNALGYTPENMTLEKGTTMTTNTPSVSGGAVTSWEISPSLPTGLSFGSTNGSIWGTPSVLQTSATTYTIWANNSGGSTSAQVNITINDQIASISYSSPVEIFNNRPLSSTITPTNTGGAVTSWEITPALPTGLTFGTSNGSIWGTPENVTSNTTYTIWANNSGGSSSATLTLNINWTLTPSVAGAYLTRNASIGTDITWEWDYDPLEAIYAGLVTGEWNTCAIDDNGDVFCWGRNGNGQIGNGQSGTSACGTSGHKCKDIPTRTTDLGSDVVALAFGHQHACGLTDAGVVKCWGRNNNGQIGTSGGDVDTPFTVSLGSGRTATSIYAGGHSTCAILDDGSTKCWGHNSDGQLGIGSTSNTNTPTTIGSLGSGRTAVSLAMAMTTVCALLDDGSVKCWGDDSYGQLGNGGTNVDINSPPASAINLGSGRTAKSITAGEYHFCAILDDNSIKCWGQGWDGKLGTGSTSHRSTPTALSGSFASGRYAVYLDAGYDHTCAILDNGDLTCWGSDAKGQLGNGAGSSSDVSSLSSSVISLGSGRTAISVSAGGQHTCAQLDNGQLKCWGNRGDGQVGDNGGFNNPSDRTSPSTVSNNNYGGNTYADTGVFPSAAVTGATCAISPALPTGLSLTSGTCAITGTPTVTAFNTTYTVWANISGQSFSGQVWLEVGLNVPILSYSPTSYVFVNGTAIAEVQPINTGGEISSFEISPALPNGLSIGSTNGTIWGTPTVASSLTTYTIWGNNSAGSSSTTISIKVETTPTSLSYDTENMTLTKGLAMTTNTATVGGGTPTSWEISPALPSGLSFSSTTGDISGTPTVLQTSTVTYTVWANNTAGSVNTSLNITINDVAPNSVVYSPENMSFTKNSAITTTTPTASGGAVTSWEISPALPSGLSFGSTNGSIWGTPTVEQSSTTYTVWANNSGGSSSGSINITVGPEAPGDFEYIPEDNVLINNTYAHLAPSFVNITTGNGTTWQVGSSDTNPGSNFAFNINGVVYFDAGSNEKLWAYSPANNTAWKVNNTVTWVGEYMAYAVEDTIYFSGHTGGTGREFYAYTTTNQTLWLVSDIRSGSTSSEPGNGGSAQDGDVLFFRAFDGSVFKWFSYNHSNGTLTSKYVYGSSGGIFAEAIGDTLYFRGRLSSSDHAEVLAYSAVNATVWEIEDIYTGSATTGSEAGEYLHTVVNGILLFDAWSGVTNDERGIWAYNPANATAWELQSADSTRSDGHVTSASTTCGQPLVLGDVAYFCATGGPGAGGYELWAYNTSNETTWLVTDIAPSGDSHPGKHMFEVLGDTLYFSAKDGSTGIELWAYDTSNRSTWRVADINSGSFHSNPGQYMTVVVGDTLYFSAKTEATNQELYAYDTSNQSLWLVEDLRAGSQSSFVGENMALVAGNKLVFNAKPSGTTSYLYGHEPSEINWMTNTGGNVTTWAINNTNLPTGLTFSTSNGTIYGTPTQLWSKTAYMVWANNSGGSSVGYLNITVVDANLSYSKYDLTLTKDQASNDLPLNATTTVSGSVTTWEISSTLPAGLNFGTSNGTIWGIPTVMQTTATTYTIWANNSGGSTSATITITINDEAPGPFEYNPENNTLTNNTYVHLEPDFINITTGNGSSWSTPAGTFMPWASFCLHHVYNGTLYTAATNGSGTSPKFYGYGLDNETAWVINGSISAPGCYRWVGYGGMSSWQGTFSMAYGTSLYFEASEGNWDGLFGYGLENDTVWRESSNELEITSEFTAVVDDVLYFGAYHNSSVQRALHAHNLSNGTTWLVLNASNGSPIQTYWTYSGGVRASVVGDVFFYPTYINSNFVYWAYNTSNGSAWAISSQAFSGGGRVLDGVFYYTSGSYYNLRQLYAYNVSNETSWQVHTRWGLNDIHEMDGVLYYGARSTTNSYTSLWAHSPDNGTTWEIGGTSQSNYFGFLDAGGTLFYRVHSGTSSERDLWAYEPSNATAWQVTTIPLNGDTFTSLGNTVYFTSESTSTSGEHDLWAYNTANETTWYVTNISATNWGFTSSGSVHHPESTSLVFAGDTLYIREGGGMRSHQPASINYQTNTGGNVTTWAINASLPSGLTFSTTNGSIYGTPTELWTQTSYMVWANNSGGSSVAYLNITVVDEVPTLSYSPSTLVLTINNQSSDLPLNATLTGSGTITSWAISPALPSGLSFGTSNGTIWGIPTVLQTTAITYTVWANNSGGSASATVNITVNDEAPDISYNPDWFVLTNNTAMSPTATPTNSGGAIPSGIIDSNGIVGAYTSIAIDSNGYKHVSYFYSTNSDLKYATDKTGSWVAISVDTTGYVGMYTSIAIDSNDAVHISYHDGSNNDLKYATCSSGCTTASNWDIVSIDTSGSVGTHTSIAIDSNDAVHISYHKGSNNYDLKYATCSSDCTSASNWDLVSVATTGLVGYDTSIAIDSNDAIHISYGDSSNAYLKYATCSSGCTSASNWNTVSIDTTITGAHETSIAIDSNDAIHISYRDGANTDLEYATCSTGCTSASNWNLVSVDTTGAVGYDSSIGVDSNDAVHISYRDGSNNDLKYATCSSGCTSASNWNDRSLDTMGAGSYTSIAIDSNDAIHISYYDGTNRDLKYVTLDSSSNLHGYSISPDLPEGLELNVNTGEISGTPTELSTNTTYTITARNSGGVNTTTITIEVIDTVPTVSYSPENLTLTNNTASSNLPLAPTITGSGAITSWALNNTSLPSGISFSTSNGTFSGTPTELWNTTAYMVWANNSGGSTVAYLNITVVDQLPTLIWYSPNDLNLTNNTGFTPPTIIVLGSGTITSWELNNTSLPTGVLFGTNNGTIYGTPTELWNRTAYMVWANNSGGSTVAYLNITVVDEVPTLSYSPTNLNLTNNTVSSDLPLVPTVTGSGTITSWAINASLPSGLSFGTNNGTIYGTPTELWYQTAYMVWANNSGGSAVAYLNITVVDVLPTVSLSPSNLTLYNNTVSTDLPLVPTVTGPGEITLWGLNHSLPSGLSFDNNNGTIWGTPTELWPTTAYRLSALNSGGTTYAYFNLTVLHQAPMFTYPSYNLTLVNNTAMTPLATTITGGDITSWEVSPSLPTGLSLGSLNGTIWGTPTVVQNTTMYTVWGNNSGGSHAVYLNITIYDPAVTLDYNPENLTLTRGVAMNDLLPSYSGVVANWTIEPALPAGLTFTNGVIAGTPTVNMTATMYTVWANNSGGSSNHTLNITILEPSGNLSYSPENITLTRGVAMSDLHPTYNGGSVENWSIHPALPAGLNFSNGVISGTPTVNMTTSMFTIYANNSGGSAAATINITILEPVVDLSYSPDNLTLMRGTTMMPLLPTVSGGNVSEWALVGVLPEGLNFSNGVFSGTPLVNMTQTQYLVYANTTGGSATAWVNITVLEPAVNLSYNPYNITLTRNVTMNPLSPTVSGGNVSNWSIFPELPAGLNFTNGTISGTPEVNMTTTMFTVWANTSGGAASTTVNITIVEPPVDFLYSPNAIVLMRNETMNATSPVFGGDAMADEWGISPALPEGLNFTNGTISGTPLVNLTATVFMIYANNTGGTAVAYLTITVLEPVATVVYVPENITLTRGEDNASLVPILGGGMVASWSISPDLPEGMVFDNGSITGVPLVNMTNTTFTVMALNSGGMAFAFLNITVVEPVAILAFNESFVVTRGEDLLNATVNNTGGTVATWEIEPALPEGVSILDGWLYGVSQANLTETVFTLWANNSGGSVNITFTLEVLEPVANISYPVDEIELIRGISRSLLIPTVEGGVPETWEIEPALPNGLALVNGYVVGLPTAVIETTTFTVWANNSGGSSVATFTLTVAYPEYYARYPVTRVVVDVNETMPTLNPIYYFGSNEDPLWSISPTLPDGLVFDNGILSGTPTVASNETNYTITVTGDMAPVEFFIIIEVREKANLTVPSVRNETEEPVFSLPEPTPPDDGFDMYFICFPILLLLLLLGVVAINNFLALAAKDDDEDEPENEAKDDEEGEG